MRVLHFAPRVCWPLDTGAKLRNYHLARVLSEKAAVTLLAFTDAEQSLVELERALAKFKKQEAAMVFPTGYSTNVGVISALMRPGDWIIMDQNSHASIVDGAILAKSNARFFRHKLVSEYSARAHCTDSSIRIRYCANRKSPKVDASPRG